MKKCQNLHGCIIIQQALKCTMPAISCELIGCRFFSKELHGHERF